MSVHRALSRIESGCHPLGASPSAEGVVFSLFSQNASGAEVCLFTGDEEWREPLAQMSGGIWQTQVAGVEPGASYGFRVYGPWEPKRGLRFNPSKLLLDPYTRALTGPVQPPDTALAYKRRRDGKISSEPDEADSAPGMPRSIVVGGEPFEWGDLGHGGAQAPSVALKDSVIYETHVRGFTKLLDSAPPELRGTYAGFGSEPAVEYFRWLGVSAVELLPVQAFCHDRRLLDMGLDNYWGYNTAAFFAPEPSYAAASEPSGAVREFQAMVKALHAGGIEVILDVVYNHTGEGNHLGPTLSLRGIDNTSYYRLQHSAPEFYADYTGTGNTLNVLHPRVLQLICDSLRYWVVEMGVDGFRFDLATALGRDETGFHDGASFFDILLQDPVLSGVKLIAEPWDIGDYGYQVGGFPHPWSEWNGQFRDTVRRYWRGDEGQVDDLASRLAGSSDIYSRRQKSPGASINFITSHDGFTLRDLVSYNNKHNHANGEDNRDGDNHNMSWNHGVEGPTDDAEISALRRRQQRNFLVSLMLAQGVPMTTEGDEYGRSKSGNNNTYCHDNELNWLRWQRSDDERRLENFFRALIALRRSDRAFRARRHLSYREPGEGGAELAWFNRRGRIMSLEDWSAGKTRTLGMFLTGEHDGAGRPSPESGVWLAWFHSGSENADVVLPGADGVEWERTFDTRFEEPFSADRSRHSAGSCYALAGRSVALFHLVAGEAAAAQESAAISKSPEDPGTEKTGHRMES